MDLDDNVRSRSRILTLGRSPRLDQGHGNAEQLDSTDSHVLNSPDHGLAADGHQGNTAGDAADIQRGRPPIAGHVWVVRSAWTLWDEVMKIIRFKDEHGSIQLGTPIDGTTAQVITGDLFGDYVVTDAQARVQRLLPPIDPVNILAIGLNYGRHAEEGGFPLPDHPVVFAKLTTTLAGPGDAILLPADAPDEVDFEAELAVVIGKTARNAAEADALDFVLGYSCANDVSARDCQIRRDQQWTRSKSFDTFCPLGPCLVIDAKMNPNALAIRSTLNGKRMQDSNTADMIFSVPNLVSYLSRQFTLLPGTLIITGTPAGVGYTRQPPVFLRPGDMITVAIEGIGELTNPVCLA